MRARNRNELWAHVLLDELVRCGVREVVVSPGSRSTPLVLAASARPELRPVVRIDERSAAFFALGVGKGTGRPAAVITTSGTAVANLFPAVVEADRAGVPLLLLTADRPPRLRGADANQAIDQTRIFGGYPRLFRELSPAEISDRTLRHLRSVACQAVAAATGLHAGPVHLNLAFEKPLEPTPEEGDPASEVAEVGGVGVTGRPNGEPFTRIEPIAAAPTPGWVEGLTARIAGAHRPLLVAGPVTRPWETGPALREFAESRGIPILADALSGARFPRGGTEVAAYDRILGSSEARRALAPDLILRVGRAPTSANLTAWLAELDALPDAPAQIVVDPGSPWKDHLAVAHQVVPARPEDVFPLLGGAGGAGRQVTKAAGGVRETRAIWLERWRRAEVAASVTAMGAPGPSVVGPSVAAPSAAGAPAGSPPVPAAGPYPGLEGTVLDRVVRRVPDEDLLFVSSSMPIRDLDAFGLERDGPLTVLANRGASGIDGITSTAAGASLGTGRRVVAVLGDLAFLHDAGGLLGIGAAGERVLLVVIHNDGGGIFHLLPIREHEPAFTPFFATPHGRGMEGLAHFHGLPVRSVDLRGTGTREEEGDPCDPGGHAGVPGDLDGALEWLLALPGSGILEIRTDRDENRRLRQAVMAAASRAAVRALEEDEGASGV